jgi:hypothetical protein
MSSEKAIIVHGGMASPAEKSHISLKCHCDRTARLVRNGGMADEADRFPVDLSFTTLVVCHAMRVHSRIKVFVMTDKTDLGSVRIRSSSQEHRSPGAFLFPVHPMTRQTPHLSIKKRKGFPVRISERTFGYEVYRMVVIAVMMTIETDGRGIYPLGEQIVF